ncbi:C40 family peptidase [Amycolatopsis sp. H20-H5]|uniref:C40 family peptidase n=1 Tax=Amycolatopsis sp. H20-H5 TaxID=3046309 RepID=UPI002DBD5DA2|nr:C40 family peptidase [Amycolatopsis sp. H20-H5]MEC3976586.1 C40 family peptidase [Amycolatopsis sp. H20-H5]
MPIRNVTALPRPGSPEARSWPWSMFGPGPSQPSSPVTVVLKVTGFVGYTLLLMAGSVLLTNKVAAASSKPAHPTPAPAAIAAPRVAKAPVTPAAPAPAVPAGNTLPAIPVPAPAPAPVPTPAPKPQPPAPKPRPQPVPDPGSGGSGAAQIAIRFALAQLGRPYVWGGAGPTGFDCSGLTMSAYRAAGKSLPHKASMQANAGKRVSTALPGDLIISNGGRHVSLALGDGKVIEAPDFGQRVSIHPMPKHIVAIVRIA